MKTSLEDDIKNLARQIYKLEKGTSSQEFYDLALELFEKVIIIKNQNSLVEKNSLTKYMEDNNLSFINDKIENPDDNEKETFTPLIETIKDMIPEMPETNIGSSIIDGVTDNILFERKESMNPPNDDIKKQKINDIFANEFKIDLNDRLAFIQKLFDNNNKEYDETISKINLYNDWESTKNFIENIVKPKYKSWDDNQILEKKFLNILRKRFDG
tara:strand:- start:3321 stop:3962 length:642 start_codon:yes stop_codon:yes gene_type:complete